jgi:hypothetical protein
VLRNNAMRGAVHTDIGSIQWGNLCPCRWRLYCPMIRQAIELSVSGSCQSLNRQSVLQISYRATIIDFVGAPRLDRTG